LVDTGWINSFLSKEPVDKNDSPIPWLTYPAISFLSERLNIDLTIFEYGSGNSTLFYSKIVKKVIAVEHEKEWFEKIKSKLQANSEIVFSKLDYDGVYCKTIKNANQSFDIIIIDAEDRVNCIKHCFDKLRENGVIILDDSEREEYQEGIEILKQKGFRRLDFWGIAAGFIHQKNTTIFYRDSNCLNI
jgi:tRNA A58 N-methylase Trm61